MSKRKIILLHLTNNRILIGTVVGSTLHDFTLKDVFYFGQNPQTGEASIIEYNMEGLLEFRKEMTVYKSGITMSAFDDAIAGKIATSYTATVSGIIQPKNKVEILKG